LTTRTILVWLAFLEHALKREIDYFPGADGDLSPVSGSASS